MLLLNCQVIATKKLNFLKNFFIKDKKRAFLHRKARFSILLYVEKAVLLTAVNCLLCYVLNSSRSFSLGDNQRFLSVAERNTLVGISFDRRKYVAICDCKSSNE